MKKRNLEKWNNINELNGLLYFVQRLDEMLFYYSLDTYKSPSLHTKMLLKEYLRTLSSIDEGLLKEKNEIPIFEEIIWSLGNDMAAKNLIGSRNISEFLKNNGSYSADKKRMICKMFLDKLSNKQYLIEAERMIKVGIEKNNKRDIDLYSKIFIRELTALGYSSQHIFRCINEVFYTKRVTNNECVEEFFEHFTVKENSYTVYFTVHKEIRKLSELFVEKLPKLDIKILLDEEIPEGIQKYDDYVVIGMEGISELDEFSAYDNGKKIIELINHFYSFYRYTDRGITSGGFVKLPSGQITRIKDAVTGAEKSNRKSTFEKSSVSAVNLFDLATTNYENLYKLSRVMEIHNMALRIESPSNVLLSLWSILELLLEKGYIESDKSRIHNIINMLMPFLLNSYIEKIFKNLLEDIRHWNSKELTILLDQVAEGKNDLERVFSFVVLNKYDEERKKLYSKLDDFPLLRYRIFSLWEQCNDNKKISKFLDNHKDKVTWHIQRIYRARNCIIHDGEDVENIENLVENLHSYIDIMCEKIIGWLSSGNSAYTVSDAILEESIQNDDYSRFVSTIKEINSDNCMVFLYHNSCSMKI